MTKIIFRSGLDTIGGTIIELIKDENRLIFDFGCVFDPSNKKEITPNVLGIYQNDSDYNDAVLISHLHLDHIKALNLIDKDIEIHMTNESKMFLNDLYQVGFDQIMGEIRPYTGCDFDYIYDINGFNVVFLRVDHDVMGASGIHIYNEDISLFYTGDYRFSGVNNHVMPKIIEYFKGKKIDAIITEGVAASFMTEDKKTLPSYEVIEYERDFVDALEYSGKILFNSYIMAVERLESILILGRKLNKKVFMFEKKYELCKKYLSDYQDTFELLTTDITVENEIYEFVYDKKDDFVDVYHNSMLLQTGGEPLGDYDPRYFDLLKYCELNNIEFKLVGIGGHTSVENQFKFLSEIEHSYLIPLHSFKRHLVKVDSSEQLLVKIDQELIFSENKLVD